MTAICSVVWSQTNFRIYYVIFENNLCWISWRYFFKYEKVFIQALDSDNLVCMTAICYCDTISAVQTNKQLLWGKWHAQNSLRGKLNKTCSRYNVHMYMYTSISMYGHLLSIRRQKVYLFSMPSTWLPQICTVAFNYYQ